MVKDDHQLLAQRLLLYVSPAQPLFSESDLVLSI
jgi:hypothetical protein